MQVEGNESAEAVPGATRPTSQAERELAENLVRPHRRAAHAILPILTALGVGCVFLLYAIDELRTTEDWIFAASLFVISILFGSLGLYLSRDKLGFRLVNPSLARFVEGEFKHEAPDHLERERDQVRAHIDGARVRLPSYWRGYLAEGRHHRVAVIETTLEPVVVWVEAGPSADEDARLLGQAPLIAPDMRPGLVFSAAVSGTVLPFTAVAAALGLAAPWWGWLLAAGLTAWGAGSLGRDVLLRRRLHEHYHASGARFAPTLAQRWRVNASFMLRMGAGVALGVGAGALLYAPQLIADGLSTWRIGASFGLFAVAFLFLLLVHRKEPPADTSNAGTRGPRRQRHRDEAAAREAAARQAAERNRGGADLLPGRWRR